MKFLLTPSAADPVGLFASVEIKVSKDVPTEKVDGLLNERSSLALWDIMAVARDASEEQIEELRAVLAGAKFRKRGNLSADLSV